MGTPGYGCQFPKDENRETEVSGFRFFSSGWCFCETYNPQQIVMLTTFCSLPLHLTIALPLQVLFPVHAALPLYDEAICLSLPFLR